MPGIGLLILHIPLVVLVALLEHGQDKHQDQGRHIAEQQANTQRRYKLRYGDDEVKHVEEVFELVVQHARHKGYYTVFLVADQVFKLWLVWVRADAAIFVGYATQRRRRGG